MIHCVYEGRARHRLLVLFFCCWLEVPKYCAKCIWKSVANPKQVHVAQCNVLNCLILEAYRCTNGCTNYFLDQAQCGAHSGSSQQYFIHQQLCTNKTEYTLLSDCAIVIYLADGAHIYHMQQLLDASPICVRTMHDRPGSVFRVNRGQQEARLTPCWLQTCMVAVSW